MSPKQRAAVREYAADKFPRIARETIRIDKWGGVYGRLTPGARASYALGTAEEILEALSRGPAQ